MKIYDYLKKLGCDEASAKSIGNKIDKLAGEYLNKKKAKDVIEESFQANVHELFSNAQLDKFIKIVRQESFNPRQFELEKELDFNDDDLDMLRESGNISEKEIREYLKERAEYVKKTRPQRESRTLQMLKHGEFYNILKQKAYRPVKEKNPNFKEPRVQVISTPMGGQGHWRRKMKRRG